MTNITKEAFKPTKGYTKGTLIHTNAYFELPKLNREVLEGFLQCALWSSYEVEEGTEETYNLDDHFSIFDINLDSVKSCYEYIVDFLNSVKEQLPQAWEELEMFNGWREVGYDFWLTSQGHGAGFWDRTYTNYGDELSDIARSYSFNIYVADEKVYID